MNKLFLIYIIRDQLFRDHLTTHHLLTKKVRKEEKKPVTKERVQIIDRAKGKI